MLTIFHNINTELAREVAVAVSVGVGITLVPILWRVEKHHKRAESRHEELLEHHERHAKHLEQIKEKMNGS